MDSWWGFGDGSGFRGSSLEPWRVQCPFCNEKGNWTTAHHIEKKKGSSKKVLNYDTLLCGNCGNYSMVFWSAGDMLYSYRMLPWPLGEFKAPDHWPADVTRFWLQARTSLKNKNYDAAIVMAGSCLQAILRKEGAVGGSLYNEIENLTESGVLPPIMKEWAHELRLVRNMAAHPTPGDQETDPEDVKDLIEFVDRLATYLIDLPHKINIYRNRNNLEEEDK